MEINCKGSYGLGNACGSCDKCKKELEGLINARIENVKLKRENDILMEFWKEGEAVLEKAILHLDELSKVDKYLIIDGNGCIGTISSIDYSTLREIANESIDVIDYSGKEPKMLTEYGFEDIPDFD
jgi:hypothetical protein